MKRSIFLAIVFSIVMSGRTLAITMPPQQEPPFSTARASCIDFLAMTQNLIKMEDLFSGGNGELLEFDRSKARGLGFPESSILLAKELTEYINAWQQGPAATDMLGVTGSAPEKPPRVSAFFHCATQYNKNEKDSLRGEASGGCIRGGVRLTEAECQCGHWLNPRPNRRAGWTMHRSSNPRATLIAAGYHYTPPPFAAAKNTNYTRPQTYRPSLCGRKTFRDHAIIEGADSYKTQEYTGWVPPGEPNPEVHRSGPWPYLTWPAYVAWWHQYIIDD